MAIPTNIRSKLSEYVNIGLGKAQATVIIRVQRAIQEKLQLLLTECPSPEVLKQIADFVNNTRPVVDNAEKKVFEANKIFENLEPAIAAGNILINVLTTNPLPPVVINGILTPFSVIPFTPATVVQNTRGKINTDAGILNWARNLVEVLEDEGRAIADGVSAAQSILSPVKAQLDQIDVLVQACAANQNISEEERNLLLDSIESKLPQDPNLSGLEYTSASGRTYTIKIIQDPTSPLVAPRRQAIVQDFRGITVLTGPGSFASRTQVLIEEIKFRIDNQLP